VNGAFANVSVLKKFCDIKKSSNDALSLGDFLFHRLSSLIGRFFSYLWLFYGTFVLPKWLNEV
jgi:hypothetical protein